MFEYTLKFRTAHANADALSRLPLAVEAAVTNTPPELVLLTEHLANSPVSAGHHIGPNIAVSKNRVGPTRSLHCSHREQNSHSLKDASCGGPKSLFLVIFERNVSDESIG